MNFYGSVKAGLIKNKKSGDFELDKDSRINKNKFVYIHVNILTKKSVEFKPFKFLVELFANPRFETD
jgi:hypothetical protein